MQETPSSTGGIHSDIEAAVKVVDGVELRGGGVRGTGGLPAHNGRAALRR